MPTTLRGLKFKPAARATAEQRQAAVLLFSVGGRRIAARAREVGGIWPWSQPVVVPSGTPFISALLRRNGDVFPVFDLARKLGVTVKGDVPLCVIAKRHDGPIAICIDSEMPSLQVIDESTIRPVPWRDSDVVGTCRIGVEEVPLYSLARLGLGAQRSAIESGGIYAKDSGRG
ncbi:chemotaxis protein CheW [Candidatus Nitrospira bockiana]